MKSTADLALLDHHLAYLCLSFVRQHCQSLDTEAARLLESEFFGSGAALAINQAHFDGIRAPELRRIFDGSVADLGGIWLREQSGRVLNAARM